jgi:hypothetical protein
MHKIKDASGILSEEEIDEIQRLLEEELKESE